MEVGKGGGKEDICNSVNDLKNINKIGKFPARVTKKKREDTSNQYQR